VIWFQCAARAGILENRMTSTKIEDDPAEAMDADSAAFAYKRLPPINGYPETFSVFPGETLAIRMARKPDADLQASPNAARKPVFIKKIEIRNAVTRKVVATTKPAAKTQILEQIPAGYRDEGAGYTCRIELDTKRLPAALYECVVTDDTGIKSGEIYFNIKSRSFEGYDLVCVLPTFTWHAYNRVGGGSFYEKQRGPWRTVSLQRPMSRKRDNFIASAIPFLTLFGNERIRTACIDSSDLHHNVCPQGRAPVMALLTHDEYWSAPMRAEIDRFLAQHGSLLVMAGNVGWWRIEIEGNNISVLKGQAENKSLWCTGDNPEENTLVSSFRFGGYPVELSLRKKGLVEFVSHLPEQEVERTRAVRVVEPGHALFRDVALGPDKLFGGDVPIMQREIDGVPLNADGTVNRTLYRADKLTPRVIATGFAVGRLTSAGLHEAGVIVEADAGGGHVLHMGTFGWSLGLIQKNEAVERVVLNAYRHCRTRTADQNFTASRSVQIWSRIFQPPRFCFWKRKK
jgi:hypothetical protein